MKIKEIKENDKGFFEIFISNQEIGDKIILKQEFELEDEVAFDFVYFEIDEFNVEDESVILPAFYSKESRIEYTDKGVCKIFKK